jgi:hypothetical protein
VISNTNFELTCKPDVQLMHFRNQSVCRRYRTRESSTPQRLHTKPLINNNWTMGKHGFFCSPSPSPLAIHRKVSKADCCMHGDLERDVSHPFFSLIVGIPPSIFGRGVDSASRLIKTILGQGALLPSRQELPCKHF